MTDTQLDTYQRRFVVSLRRLAQDELQLRDQVLQATGGESSGSLSNVPLHPADLGSHEYEEGLAVSLLGKEENLAEEIEAACTRIELGTFGRCELCRKKISQERLRAVPYTRYCVKCADKTHNPTN